MASRVRADKPPTPAKATEVTVADPRGWALLMAATDIFEGDWLHATRDGRVSNGVKYNNWSDRIVGIAMKTVRAGQLVPVHLLG